MSKGNPDWSKYDVDRKMPCVNWGIPGKEQIRAYKLCKKWGKDPQKDFHRVWKNWLNELSNSEVQLEEMRVQRDYLSTQIDLLEKNTESSIIINEKLIKDIDDHINQYSEGSSYRWGYAIMKKLSARHDLSFNEIHKVFNQRIPLLIHNNEYREKICYFFRFVADRAKNGMLTDQEIDNMFPLSMKASV